MAGRTFHHGLAIGTLQSKSKHHALSPKSYIRRIRGLEKMAGGLLLTFLGRGRDMVETKIKSLFGIGVANMSSSSFPFIMIMHMIQMACESMNNV
jgi:hypothetical protein